MRVLYVRLLAGRVHFARLSWTFLVMKCFIDSVVQEAPFCFIIIVMMPEGFLKQKKKCRVTFIFITIIQSLFVSVASLSGSSLSWGAWTGQGSQGTVVKAVPDRPGKCSCWQGDPMRRKTLVVKSTGFSQGVSAASRVGKEAGLGRCTWTWLIY